MGSGANTVDYVPSNSLDPWWILRARRVSRLLREFHKIRSYRDLSRATYRQLIKSFLRNYVINLRRGFAVTRPFETLLSSECKLIHNFTYTHTHAHTHILYISASVPPLISKFIRVCKF